MLARDREYSLPRLIPLPWLIRYGAPTGLSLVGIDSRLQRGVPRMPRGMFSVPVPAPRLVRYWGFGGFPHPIRYLVVVGSPELVREVFAADPEQVHFGVPPIGNLTGHESLFYLNEGKHLYKRRLVLPPFHGERMRAYEVVAEEEALRVFEGWPEGREFRTSGSFMQITVNVILRAVFGMREGPLMDEMRLKAPRAVTLGSRMMVAPPLQRDLGPWSPWGYYRRLIERFEWIVNALVDEARRDPNPEQRTDVLALFARATHEDDGSLLSDQEIADELKAVVAAGHETTGITLGWAVERLRRHPEVLRRLVAEADEGGKELREATIREVQRTRPVIPGTGRLVMRPFTLGGYRLPPGTLIALVAPFLHNDPETYPHPERFDPDRFLGKRPDPNTWIPFGGGVRRCPGAAFAHMEMDIVLRTLLRNFELVPTTKAPERMFFRGIAWAPLGGGKAIVHRRQNARQRAASSAEPVAA